MNLVSLLFSSLFLIVNTGIAADYYSDDYRKNFVEGINKADGIKTILGSKRPIKLDNGLLYHGWLYNKDLDVAIIQYTFSGKLYKTYKDGLTKNILVKWRGDTGLEFRKVGFKDIAVLITEASTSAVYSSRQNKWYSVSEYTALNFKSQLKGYEATPQQKPQRKYPAQDPHKKLPKSYSSDPFMPNQQPKLNSKAKWLNKSNWRKIKTDMAESSVTYILGSPTRVDGGNLTIYYYQGNSNSESMYGTVTFWDGKVSSWREPDFR